MRKIIFAAFLLLVTSPAFAGGEHEFQPYTGSALFEKLKTLEGKWTGTVQHGKGEVSPAEVNYEVSSGKTALIEKLFQGTPAEMVSIYNDENGELVMTHYCMMRNQPKLKVKKAARKQIELEMFEANGVKMSDAHMHDLKITFDGPDSITQEWRGYEDGKLSDDVTVVKLKRA